MPQGQVAQGSHYQFGAPAAEAPVLEFAVKHNQGGDLVMTFEAPDSTRNVTYSVQVSEDGVTYADTTAAANKTAVVDAVHLPKTQRTFNVGIRAGVDKFVRVIASGSDRMGVTIKGNEILELLNIEDFQGGGAGDD